MPGYPTLTVVCPRRCGKGITFERPALPTIKHRGVLGRWWRRRTVRLLFAQQTVRLGQAVEQALLYHYLTDCPLGLAAEIHDDEPAEATR